MALTKFDNIEAGGSITGARVYATHLQDTQLDLPNVEDMQENMLLQYKNNAWTAQQPIYEVEVLNETPQVLLVAPFFALQHATVNFTTDASGQATISLASDYPFMKPGSPTTIVITNRSPINCNISVINYTLNDFTIATYPAQVNTTMSISYIAIGSPSNL